MTKTWAEKLADKENFPKIVKLEKEGHKIILRGKKFQVADFEKCLWTI